MNRHIATFKPTDRAPRVRRIRPLPNPVVNGNSKRLVEQLVVERMESNPWYHYNVHKAMAKPPTDPVVFRNVMARLYQRARYHAERQLGVI